MNHEPRIGKTRLTHENLHFALFQLLDVGSYNKIGSVFSYPIEIIQLLTGHYCLYI